MWPRQLTANQFVLGSTPNIAFMLPPITYQGGKQRIASQILDIIQVKDQFYDLCCGSGSISIELINRGHSPEKIFMLDKGPWGLFWQKIGDGSFDLSLLKSYCDKIPKNVSMIQGYIKDLSHVPADVDTVYVFLLLQAASFGGKAIWIKDNKWKNCSFRSYWLPTEMSSRRSPVNPMMPMPSTLYSRVELIAKAMKGIVGRMADIMEVEYGDGIIYVDPPYSGTTFYGHDFDIMEFAKKAGKCYVSEGKPLSEKAWQIVGARKKGGISGLRKSANEEWLSEISLS